MPRKTNETNNEIEEKLKYIGLDLNDIPKTIKEFEPLDFRPSKMYQDKQYRQYKYISVKDIELLLSPTNRLEEIDIKYSKAMPVYSYLVPDTEENMIRHTTFLNMLNKVKIEDIEAVEEEQKELNKKIPFKVKFQGNYLWQIYYSENADKYFMLVPTEDSDYSTFFYVLKKKLEKRKGGKIFVPISNVGYSRKCLKKSEFEDIENYLWLFTKDWPLIYEVSDKSDRLSVQIIGETEVFQKIKTPYKIKLSNQIEATQFYKLLKALFILQTELPHYYNFETNIDKDASLEFYYKGQKIQYEDLTDFIKNQYIELEKNKEKVNNDITEFNKKLEELKLLAVQMEIEYLAKEKQISTFLECKKSFFGKFKYYFKYSKKKKLNAEKEETKQDEEPKEIIENEEVKKEEKEYYTLEELIEKYKEYEKLENQLKNLVMDVNAIKLKNKNLNKKIENATSFIEEIDKHKRSIFEFWKYSNKDEMATLPEGEEEMVNVIPKISKTFDYSEDIEEFGKNMDKKQRKKLSKEETDSIYITTTEVLDILNKIKMNDIAPKEIQTNLKELKERAKSEKSLTELEEFDVFGGIIEDKTKIKKLANKKHRELPKDKFSILDINKNTKQLGYKLTLEQVLQNISNALEKSSIEEDIPVYLTSTESNLETNKLNICNLDLEDEIKQSLKQENSKINLFKINVKAGTNAVCYTNIIYFDNQNKTLPLGMDISSKILVDISKLNLQLKEQKSFRVVGFEEENNEMSKTNIKTINVYDYDVLDEQ